LHFGLKNSSVFIAAFFGFAALFAAAFLVK